MIDWSLIVAIISLLVSGGLAILELGRYRRWIAVFCDVGLVGDTNSPDEAVVITAVNRGHRPVTIVAAGIRVHDGQLIDTLEALVKRAGPLPETLNYGEYVAIPFYTLSHTSGRQVLSGLKADEVKRLQVYVRDAEQKEFTARLPQHWIDRVLSGEAS